MADVIGKVNVESIIHDAIANVVQAIYDQHHIEVNRIAVTFVDTSTHGSAARRVRRIEIESSSEHL